MIRKLLSVFIFGLCVIFGACDMETTNEIEKTKETLEDNSDGENMTEYDVFKFFIKNETDYKVEVFYPSYIVCEKISYIIIRSNDSIMIQDYNFKNEKTTFEIYELNIKKEINLDSLVKKDKSYSVKLINNELVLN